MSAPAVSPRRPALAMLALASLLRFGAAACVGADCPVPALAAAAPGGDQLLDEMDDREAEDAALVLLQPLRPRVLRTAGRQPGGLLEGHKVVWTPWLLGERMEIKDIDGPTVASVVIITTLATALWVALAVWALRHACCPRKGEGGSVALRVALVVAVVGSLVAAAVLLLHFYAGVVLQRCIQHFDVSFLGTKIEIEHLDLHPFRGILTITGLTVRNPEGYKSDYLLQAEQVKVDLGTVPLLLSLGHSVNINTLTLKGASIFYERALTTSNVEDVINILRHRIELAAVAPEMFGRQVLLHKVDIENVRARAATTFALSLGVTMWLSDMHYADFEKETGSNSMDTVILVLYQSLLRSVLKAFER